MSKFKVGDKIALAYDPKLPCYIITRCRGNNTYDCKTLSGTATGLIDDGIIDQWVVFQDDNYIVDKVLNKYS